MKVRYLGHSCIEIIGKHHILIDPDFLREPNQGVEYILITHAHKDHISRVAEITTGKIIASEDVCDIAYELGVPRDRLISVSVGDQIKNIKILKGFSRVNDPVYSFFYFLFRWRLPEPGGTPLSFFIEDEASLLHIGDAFESDFSISPDILCLPWRISPFGPKRYSKMVIKMANQISPKYIIPIHYDLEGTEANPEELLEVLNIKILLGNIWHYFKEKTNKRNI